jgi:formylglycine-generating enzyme required for sulfatase activity
VWEWTETPAHAYGLEIEVKGNIFIRRGGSWWHGASNCRLSYRYASDRSKKTSGLGLRVVIRENID